MPEKRIAWIDFAKGFTIFLVVVGHVMSGLLYSKSFSDHRDVLLFLYTFIGSIRMPLFFMVSGFLYSTKIINNTKELGVSISNKLIGLGIPYLIFSVFIWFTKFFYGEGIRIQLNWMDLLMIPIAPIEYFWFLYTLLLVFILIELFDYVFKNKFIVLFLVAVMAVISWNYQTPAYFINQTLYMAIFFYIGKILRENMEVLKNKIFISLCFLIFISLQIVKYTTRHDFSAMDSVTSAAGVFVILSISSYLKETGKIFQYFSKIGKKTMPIYLLHPPVASAVRLLLLKFGILNITIHFFIGLSVAWFLPIFLYYLAQKSRYTDFLFYPGKYWKIRL